LEAPKKRGKALVYFGRAIQAAVFVAINYAIFFATPILLFSTSGLLTLELETAISNYFLVIVSLTVLHILSKEHIIGIASSVGLAIVQALYIYVITEGGELTFPYSSPTYGDLMLTLKFEPIIYLMMAIPLINMVKQISDYVGRSSAQPIEMVEVVEG